MNSTRYVVITPVRDEEMYIEQTLSSMVSQTVTPIIWIIVDDGSTDRTAQIIERYAERYLWISKIQRQNRGFRQPGGGVIDAFYEAYGSLQTMDWDFIVKLDGDLSFDHEYFEKCFNHFRSNPKLGIAGGMISHNIRGKLRVEKQPLFHVRGATKIYKKDCWESIGGLVKAPGWDTVDEVKANMLGYQTQSFEELKIVHHRPTGTSMSKWSNAVKDGRADYITGYHPIFFLLKCMKRSVTRPSIAGALGFLWGYITGYMRKIPQVEDKDLIKYVRQQQMSRILFKPTIWK